MTSLRPAWATRSRAGRAPCPSDEPHSWAFAFWLTGPLSLSGPARDALGSSGPSPARPALESALSEAGVWVPAGGFWSPRLTARGGPVCLPAGARTPVSSSDPPRGGRSLCPRQPVTPTPTGTGPSPPHLKASARPGTPHPGNGLVGPSSPTHAPSAFSFANPHLCPPLPPPRHPRGGRAHGTTCGSLFCAHLPPPRILRTAWGPRFAHRKAPCWDGPGLWVLTGAQRHAPTVSGLAAPKGPLRSTCPASPCRNQCLLARSVALRFPGGPVNGATRRVALSLPGLHRPPARVRDASSSLCGLTAHFSFSLRVLRVHHLTGRGGGSGLLPVRDDGDQSCRERSCTGLGGRVVRAVV